MSIKPGYNQPPCEGFDISLAIKIWTDISASECRIELFSKLVKMKIGFRDVEDYNASLNLKLRSNAFKMNSDLCGSKVVREIMLVKLRDEVKFHSESVRERNCQRT